MCYSAELEIHASEKLEFAPRCTHEIRNDSEQVIEVIEESKLKPSLIMSHSTKINITI